MGKVILILGILGILLGCAVAIVSLLLPTMTRNVSQDEAMIGVIAGIAVFALSLLPAILGVVLMIVNRNKLKA